jgi:hypothetical protein
MAHVDHIDVAGEMHALARLWPLAAGNHVPARIGLAIPWCAERSDQLGLEPRRSKPTIQIFADLPVIFAGRIQGRDADQLLGERNQIVAPFFQRRIERCVLTIDDGGSVIH